ncbi:MAG: fibronectin type III domain-containing protein [Verrucomicrobiota bacterium]
MPHRNARLSQLCATLLALPGLLHATNQTTYHNDLASTGVNANETLLTPSSVTVANFAKRFTTTVDGQVYAQPLYVAGVTVVGGSNVGVHDLALVATQHDSVYAIDANSGSIVWQTSLLTTGLTNATAITPMPSGDTGSTDVTPEIGVCGTPVFDPATNLLYVAAKTKQILNSDTTQPHYVYTLYKIAISNGNASVNANITGSTIIGDTTYNGSYTYRTNSSPAAAQDPFVFGTGDGTITVNSTSRVYFNAMREMNRPGLTISGGKVYIEFASHGDNGPYHGWVLGYDKATLALASVLNLTPNGGLGGVWQAGGNMTMDAAGSFYLETGNGTFDGYNNAGAAAGLDASGFPVNGNYGDCFVKIQLDATTTQSSQNKNGWGMKVVDYFSPFNNQALSSADTDLGSGGCVVLPDSAGSLAHPHLLVGAGKEGKIYLIDTASMGKFNATTDVVVQTQGGAINGSYSTPAFFNGVLYWVGGGDYGKAFTIAGGVLSAAPVRTTPDHFAWPGSTPSISANGSNNGIAWTLDHGTNELRAYLASDFSSRVWTSSQAAGNRDLLGTIAKFALPTVADGHVLVGTASTLVIFGALAPPTAPPAAPGSLVTAVVSGLEIDLAWTDLSTNEDGFKIEQSTNGTDFTEIATLSVNATSYHVTGLQVATLYYFRVRSYNSYQTLSFSGYTNTAAAQTSAQQATLAFGNGFATSASQLSYNGSAKLPGTRAELTDGAGNEVGAVWSKTVQDIRRFTTQFAFQITNPNADGFTFTIQNNTNTTVGVGGGALGYQNIIHSIAVKFDIYPALSTTGLYTNGAIPDDTTPAAIDVTGAGIDFHSGHIFSVSLAYNGSTLAQTITDATSGAFYTHNYTVDIPTTIGSSSAYVGFTAATGGQTATQDILTWNYTPLPTAPPAAPSALSATPASGTQLNLAWADNATTEDGFKVERKTGSGGSYAQIGLIGVNRTSFIDPSLTPGTSYYYRVRATNSAGDSTYSNDAIALTPVQPNMPTGARASSVSANQINMTWIDNANNEDNYRVLRKITSASNYAIIATLPPNTTSYLDTGINPGVTYDYHIQASNLAGYSDFSAFTVQSLTILTLAASDATAQEGTANAGLFSVSRVGETAADLVVAFTQASGAGQAAAGTRFTLNPGGGTVTIPSGSLSATVSLTPLGDAAVLGPQNVTLNLLADAAYALGATTAATVQLLDSPASNWKVLEFGSLAAAQSPAAADGAAPAGDQITNLEKYALGLHPSTFYRPDSPALPAARLDAALGKRLTLVFLRPHPAPADISYSIESLGDLRYGPWVPLGLLSGYPIDNGDGTETVKAADTESTSTAARRFIHLRITRP